MGYIDKSYMVLLRVKWLYYRYWESNGICGDLHGDPESWMI